jgi:hypothetical protein
MNDTTPLILLLRIVSQILDPIARYGKYVVLSIALSDHKAWLWNSYMHIALTIYIFSFLGANASHYIYHKLRQERIRSLYESDLLSTIEGKQIILYLRSFNAAAKSTSTARAWVFFNSLYNYVMYEVPIFSSSSRHDPEIALIESMGDRHIVIAIGDKHDGMGAFKINPTDENWKAVFFDLCNKALFIACSAGSSESSLWEIEQIVGTPEWKKKSFLFKPSVYHGSRFDISKLQWKLFEHGITLPYSKAQKWVAWLGEGSSRLTLASYDDFVTLIGSNTFLSPPNNSDAPEELWKKLVAPKEYSSTVAVR